LKPTIIFIHTSFPAQFGELGEYLNRSGLADAYFMTTPGHIVRNKDRYSNLIPFRPHVALKKPYKYYYSGKIERAGRQGLGIFRKLKKIVQNKKIDLIVAHGSLASPHFLFDEFDIPIVSYIEFPSYADHGWNVEYPPTEPQVLIDKNMQMLSYYEAIKSDCVIVPSMYAKRMFPEILQAKIKVQFEGFCPEKLQMRSDRKVEIPAGKKSIGFSSRDLSTAKGIDLFLRVARYLIDQNANVHFVIIGDAKKLPYGYENLFIENEYGKDSGMTFIDYLLNRYSLPREWFTFTGKLQYQDYSEMLYNIDLFLYPLQFGSGNWGIIELLGRGCVVIGSNRCFLPEVITHDLNGLIVDSDSPKDWGETALELLNDRKRCQRLSQGAREYSKAFHMPVIARKYVSLFNTIIRQYNLNVSPAYLR
jgi:glycosyltransferase involved in cell wall biosynthesis